MEWRCLTVAYLTRDKVGVDQHRCEQVVNRIMEWCMSSLNVAIPTRVAGELKQHLHDRVVRKSIDFSITLRRMLGVAELSFPISLHDQVDKWLKTGQRECLSIFVQPQLTKLSLSSMAEDMPVVVLTEAVSVEISR